MNSALTNTPTIPPIVWKPKDGAKLKIKEFWKCIGEKYNIKIENYWDLHQWSIKNVADFWAEMWDYTGVICSRTYDRVLDPKVNMAELPKWFEGAKLNYAENTLKYRDDHTAIIVDGEDRISKKITYAELYAEVCRYGAALRQLGLKKNDTVVCYMSNREEAIFAMLATTAAGAIWSGALPFYGPEAVVKRFSQINPKFLFTVDRFVYDKEEKDMMEKIEEISHTLKCLEKIIVIPSKSSSRNKDISEIRNGCFLDEFLLYGINSDGSIPDLHFEQVPFDHPVFISYTSGTTGNPKGLVHGFGGALNFTKDFWLQGNGSRDHIWLSFSPPGWASWIMFCSKLLCGMTIIVYDGFAFFLSPTYLWDLVDRYGITNLFLTVSCLDDLDKKNYIPNKSHSLSTLEGILSGGSVVKPQNYDFVYNKVKPDVAFSSIYGFTEVMGTCTFMEQSLPLYKGEVPVPSLGVDLQCFNDEGKAVMNERGELVIVKPLPSLPLFMWNDDNGKTYRNTYFNKFSDNVFTTGDIGMINSATKGITLFGRSDDILKQRGCRFGSAEIYNIVNPFDEVRDTLCVAQYNGRGDERAILFIKMESKYHFTNDLVSRIRKTIATELSKRHVPDIILEIKEIPVNMNGKKLELIVKKVINNMPYDPSSVANKECLSLYQNIPELKDVW